MKKVTAIFLTILTVLSLLTVNSYADIASPSSLGEDLDATSPNDINEEIDSGTATYTSEDENGNASQKTKTLAAKQGIGVTVLRALALVLSFIPKLGNYFIQLVANTKDTFTIINLLSNKYDLFGINFWETDTGNNDDLVNSIRENVAKGYTGVRNISAVIILVLLLYTGLRMAILLATDGGASPKQMAKYKQMLIDWTISICLIYILHILMITIIYASNLFVSMIVKATSGAIDTNIETQIIDKTINGLFKNGTTANHPVYFFIVYCMLTYYEVKFFVVYLLRTFKIYFYVVISPLVCATYSLDKMRDGTAQAFQNWWIEFLTEVIKQPVQLLIFSIFVLSADEIFASQPLLFVILLGLISNIERIVNEVIIPRRAAFNKELKDVKVNNLVPKLK